jgi:hypothetical protein
VEDHPQKDEKILQEIDIAEWVSKKTLTHSVKNQVSGSVVIS